MDTKPANIVIQQDDLFTLIKSMNRSEKGYFKKYISLYGDKPSNYLRLFELMDSLPEYDIAVLKKKAKGESFLKHLSVTKDYLYKILLRSLTSYHKESNLTLELIQTIAEIELLGSRNLFDQALKLNEKAENMVRESDRIEYSPTLAVIKNKLQLYEGAHNQGKPEDFEEKQQAYAQVAKDLKTYITYSILLNRVIRLLQSNDRATNDEIKQQYQQIMEHAAMQVDPENINESIRDTYYEIKKACMYAFNDLESVLAIELKQAKVFETKPKKYTEQRPTIYISIAYNIASLSLLTNKADIAKDYSQKLKNFEVPKYLQIFKDSRAISIEIRYLKLYGKMGDTTAWLKENHDRLMQCSKEAESVYNEYILLARTGIALVFDDEPELALEYLNKVTNESPLTKLNFYMPCWYWGIIAHYLLGNYRLVVSLAESAERKLKRQETNHEVEFAVLKGLKKLGVSAEHGASIKQLEPIKELIEQSLADIQQDQLNHYQELLQWLNLKLKDL